MNAPTDWTSALAILAAGLILGLAVFLRFAPPQSIRGNETARTGNAAVMRSCSSSATSPTTPPTTTAPGSRRRRRKSCASSIACPQRPRRNHSRQEAAHRDRRVRVGRRLHARRGGIVYYASTFAGDDTNVEAQITQAKDAFARNDLMAAFEQTNAVLAKNPDEPRALTYNAVVRLSMGEIDKASSMLQRATQSDPKLLDAWVALAQTHLHAGRQKEALAAIEAAIAQHPEEEKRLRDVFATMQKPAANTAELPPDHPPLPGHETAATMPSSASSQPIHITLSLDASTPQRGGIIYVIARGAEAGHPVAVRRIDTNAFPVTLDLGGRGLDDGRSVARESPHRSTPRLRRRRRDERSRRSARRRQRCEGRRLGRI